MPITTTEIINFAAMIEKAARFFLIVLPMLLLLILIGCEPAPDAEEEVTVDTLAAPGLVAINEQIRSNPNEPELYFTRANLYNEKGKVTEAIQDLEKAISLDSSKAYYHITLSDIYLFGQHRDKGLPDSRKAIEILTNYLDKYPDNPEAHFELAATLTYIGRYRESINRLEQALQLKNYYPDAYFLRAVNFKHLGDTARAISNYQNVLEQDAENWEAHYELGILYSAVNNERAVNYFNNAIRLDSTNLDAYYGKAKFLQDRGRYEEAIDIYKKIIEKDPQHEQAYYNIGYIHFDRDSINKAYSFFDMAVKVEPSYANAYYMKGLAAEERGDLNDAHFQYRQALAVDRNHQLAQEGLDRIKKN